MQAGILAGGAGRQYAQRQGVRTCLLWLALSTAVLVAGCASRTKPAPITHLSVGEVHKPVQQPVAPPVTTSYTVAAGDTLTSIARSHDTTVASLTQLNQIENPDRLFVGQVLRLNTPPAINTATPTSAGASSAATANTTPTSSPPATATQTPANTTPARPPSVPRASDAHLILWDWPASGRIVQAFNVNTKGIDLEGNIGDPVKAAANGTVMYAGNGVRGLGNLILLGHSNGFISAYAHNQVLLVKTGQQIKQGAQIATIGQSDTTSPRLHFEIRRRGTPVNPLSYLPAR